MEFCDVSSVALSARMNWCSCASVVIFANSGETNSLSQFFSPVFSPQCVVQCTLHEFFFQLELSSRLVIRDTDIAWTSRRL